MKNPFLYGRRDLAVRHPSYGGQSQFAKQIRTAYALQEDEPTPLLL